MTAFELFSKIDSAVIFRKLLLYLLFLPIFTFSQKQGNVWYFGEGAVLDFNVNPPAASGGGLTGWNLTPGGLQEGSSSICDSTGALLFYTGGKFVVNRANNIMPNGNGLLGGTSASQAALIVPKPGSERYFYIFTADEFQTYGPPNNNQGYRYSVVDMCLNNGYGDVLFGEKNVWLMNNSGEKLAACKDQSGNGYWILGHEMFTDAFVAWHLTSAGITSTVVSNVGAVHGPNAACGLGQMKFNPQGTKVALAVGNYDPGFAELFDFDKTTGIVSNPCHILFDSTVFGSRAIGVEFSPDGTKLYVGGAGGCCSKIYQYNLLAGGGSCQAIHNSKVSAITTPSPGGTGYLQLAPNGRIYCQYNGYYNLACIYSPNQPGLNCNFVANDMTLGNYHYCLPAYVAGYQYSNNSAYCADEHTGLQEQADRPGFFLKCNSATGEVQISSEQILDEIIVRDYLGNVLYQYNPNQSDLSFEIIKPGVYFIFVRCNSSTSVRKIFVQG